jgi:hypothetical protein
MKSLKLVNYIDLLQITIFWKRMSKIISIKFKIWKKMTKNKSRHFKIWFKMPKIWFRHLKKESGKFLSYCRNRNSKLLNSSRKLRNFAILITDLRFLLQTSLRKDCLITEMENPYYRNAKRGLRNSGIEILKSSRLSQNLIIGIFP